MSKSNQQIIKASHPFADKFVLAVAKFINVIAALTLVVSIIYCFWVGWAFSMKLRDFLDSTFWSILVYVAVTAFVFGWGVFALKLMPKLLRFDRPVFGELGGLPLPTFMAAIRARGQINVELFESDQPLARRFNMINFRILHDLLKNRFEQISQDKGVSKDKTSDEWANIWNNQVLNITVDGQRFRDAADINKFGMNYAISALLRSTFVLPYIATLFWAAMIFIIYSYANQNLSLLIGIQVCLVLTFLLAAFWHIFVLHNLSVFPMTFKGLSIPESIREEFEEDISAIEGKEIHPKNIQVKRKFYQVLRNYQLTLLSSTVLSDISLLLLLIGASFGIIFIIDAEYARTLTHYHATIAYGLLIASCGLVSGFYVFSVVLQNFQKIVAALFVALLAAGLPFLIDYLLGGELNIAGAREAIFAGSGGLTVALVTSITSHVKESME